MNRNLKKSQKQRIEHHTVHGPSQKNEHTDYKVHTVNKHLDNLGSDRQYLFKNLRSGPWEVQFLDGWYCIKNEVADKERQLFKKRRS
jgi:hypothetical protein